MSDKEPVALHGARIYAGRSVLDDHAVLVESGVVIDLVPERSVPSRAQRKRLADCILAPGFIDLQVNGGGDVLFGADPTVASLSRVAAAHARTGTTRFLPTVITGPRAVMGKARVAVQSALGDPDSGVIGVHYEGPFLNAARKGVHDATQMRSPDDEDIALLTPMRGGTVLVTLAPEAVPAGFIASLANQGIRVAAGHTDAAPDVVLRAQGEGLSLYTHLYNAMSPLQARAPGVVGMALADTAGWCSIIADGHHVHDAPLRAAWLAKPPGKLLLVSDAMPPVGGSRRSFKLDGRTIAVREGRCVTADGVLAGSAIGLGDAVRHCVQKVGLPLDEVLRMASTYVAEYLRRDDLGRIAPGARADMVALDSDLSVVATWREGRLVYDRAKP